LLAIEKGKCYVPGMQVFQGIFSDRGSKYAVSGGEVQCREDAQAFLTTLCRDRKFARATHNTWGVILPDGPLKNDDGESGAGLVILRMLERAALENHIIVVTRWYGGTKLGGDRFRRVQDAVRYYLENKA
jgi:putative IMPACT (imprinted ancient) family translation regulator